MVDSKIYEEWFAMAQKDLRSAEILFEHNADNGNISRTVQYLNTFYIETRYPAEDPLVIEKDDAQECLRIAKSIMNFVDSDVKTKNG